MVVDTLKDKLVEHGHQVSVTRVPFPSTLDHKLITNMLSCRCLSFDDADKVIAFKFPAYYVRHENKTLWMFHQLRQVYELWNTEYGLQHTAENVRIREVVTSSDNAYLREAKEIFGISHEIADRLKKFNGLEASVLYTPLDHRRCRARDYGDYLLYASRVTSFKRQHLAIESMKHTKSGVRLVLAGKCDEPDYETRLRKLVDDNGKLLVDDPKVRAGLVNALRDYTNIRTRGCTPPSSTSSGPPSWWWKASSWCWSSSAGAAAR